MRKRVLIAAVLLALAGCTSSKPSAPDVEHLTWRSVTLPHDPAGRDLVRAAAVCGDHWFVAGGILHSDGTTSPALWTSTDGTSFAPMTVHPLSYYGPKNTLSTVACKGGDAVALGAASGGGHGNPRWSSWLSVAGGPLTEIKAGLELYGGEDGIGVGPVSAGDAGYLIVGARLDHSGGAGAAVWTSPDGTEFTLHDDVAALESDARGVTEVHAATAVNGGYVAVGGITPPHSPEAARDPVAWTSSNGVVWQRSQLPASAADDPLLNVARLGDGVLAIGTDGHGFSAWTANLAGADWHVTGHFGALAQTSSVPLVPSLVQTGTDTAYAVVSDSSVYQLWRGGL
ncbi:MAG TPA: hypothetical protein VGJ28_07280, partial [Micromonosporaceae bacterium]